MERETALEPQTGRREGADASHGGEDFERNKAQWEEERRRVEADLQLRQQVLDRQQAELEAEALRLSKKHLKLAEREAGMAGTAGSNLADQNTTDTQSARLDSNPAGLAAEAIDEQALFARLKACASFKPEPEVPPKAKATATAEQQVDPAQCVVPNQATGEDQVVGGSDHEESIDDYMARLFNRIRGSEPDVAQPQVKVERRPSSAPRVESRAPAVVNKEPPASAENSEPDAPREAVQLVARSAPPELSVNLQAMRELANMTARGAIDKHAQGRWSRAALGNTALGVACLVSGPWLMVRETLLGSFTRAAGLVALIGGIFWLCRGALLFNNIRQVGRRTTKFVEAESHPATHDAPLTPESEPEPLDEEAVAVAANSDS
jgi:hypothetical protein